MSEEAFRIRAAAPADAREIARLSNELGYPATDAQMAARLAALAPLTTHYIAVAEAPDRLLGWVAMERRLLLVSGEKAELMGLVVASQMQRKGIGKALLAAAERWAAAQGLDAIVVRSNTARTASHPFYERLGYTRSKTQRVYVKALPA